MKRIYIHGEDPNNYHVNVMRLVNGKEIAETYGALLPKIYLSKYQNDKNFEVVDVRKEIALEVKL